METDPGRASEFEIARKDVKIKSLLKKLTKGTESEKSDFLEKHSIGRPESIAEFFSDEEEVVDQIELNKKIMLNKIKKESAFNPRFKRTL